MAKRKTTTARTYLVGGLKGGTGKSTFALNLAVWLAKKDRNVLLADTDEQGSVTSWAHLRAAKGVRPGISIASLDGEDVGQHIMEIGVGFDDVVIDVGGYNSVELHAALEVADVLLTPARAGYFDYHSLTLLNPAIVNIRRTKNKKLQTFLVLNGMSTNARAKDEPKLRASVSNLEGFNTLNPFVRLRGAIMESIPDGKSVLEHKPRNSKAISEIEAVFNEVFNHGN